MPSGKVHGTGFLKTLESVRYAAVAGREYHAKHSSSTEVIRHGTRVGKETASYRFLPPLSPRCLSGTNVCNRKKKANPEFLKNFSQQLPRDN
jgi:hypothetical protein